MYLKCHSYLFVGRILFHLIKMRISANVCLFLETKLAALEFVFCLLCLHSVFRPGFLKVKEESY